MPARAAARHKLKINEEAKEPWREGKFMKQAVRYEDRAVTFGEFAIRVGFFSCSFVSFFKRKKGGSSRDSFSAVSLWPAISLLLTLHLWKTHGVRLFR